MELGSIGLGRMGMSMVGHLIRAGHTVLVYDPSETALAAAVEQGAVPGASACALVKVADNQLTIASPPSQRPERS